MKNLVTILAAAAAASLSLVGVSQAQAPMAPATPAAMAAPGGATLISGRLSGVQVRPAPCGPNGARRCALNNSELIEDHDDVFTYPQKAHSKYNRNRVRIDTDGTDSQGTFFSKTGSGGAWGLAVSHAPVITRSGIDAREGNGVAAYQVLDLFFSGGGKKAWGLRLNIANGGKVDASKKDENNLNFGLAAGYSTTGNFSMDVGAKLHYASGSIKDSGASSIIDFQANLRGYMKGFGKKVDLGILTQLSYNTFNFVPDQGDTETVAVIGVRAGAGPVFRLGDSTVATYGLIKIRSSTDARPKDQYLDIAIPELNIAFETPINDWATFRGGIGYNFIVSGMTPDKGDPASRKAHTWTNETPDAGGATSSVGLAGKWDDLTLDLTINKAWLVNGPDFLSGGGAGAWASKAAVSYNW